MAAHHAMYSQRHFINGAVGVSRVGRKWHRKVACDDWLARKGILKVLHGPLQVARAGKPRDLTDMWQWSVLANSLNLQCCILQFRQA